VAAFEGKSKAINMKSFHVVLIVFLTVISIKVVGDLLSPQPVDELEQLSEQSSDRVDALVDWINEPE
jgi:hypothetical protein